MECDILLYQEKILLEFKSTLTIPNIFNCYVKISYKRWIQPTFSLSCKLCYCNCNNRFFIQIYSFELFHSCFCNDRSHYVPTNEISLLKHDCKYMFELFFFVKERWQDVPICRSLSLLFLVIC